MHILVDILIVGAILFCGWQGWKRGIIGSVLAVVFIFVAVYGGNLVAHTYSNEFTSMFRPFVSGYLDGVERDAVEELVPPHIAHLSTEDLFRLEPDIESELVQAVFMELGVHESRTEKLYERYFDYRLDDVSVNRAMTNTLVYAFCFFLVFIIGFLLILIALTVAYNIIPFSFKIAGSKVVKLVDGISGAVLGLAQGLLLIFMLTWLLGYIGLLLPEELLESTRLTEFFVRSNPMTNFIDM